MASSPVEDEMNLLISGIVAASQTPAKARATNIRPTVTDLTSLAYEKGLLPDALRRLVELVCTPGHLDQASLSSIARNLYPATKVPADVALRVVGALGHGRLKPSLGLQAALLRWLVMAFQALEAQATLAQAYSVMFNLLDTAAIRPQLCHLLALITRRKHVRPFRIRALMELSRQTGNDPHLVGLLRVFKDYYPEIIVGETVRGKASGFGHPDPSWRERLHEIQDAHLSRMEQPAAQTHNGFRVNRPMGRQRRQLLPTDSVTLEEIESVASFVRHLEKIELPNQLVAMLADPLLQKLLLLRPNQETSQRIANWLDAVLRDVIEGNAEETMIWEVLDIMYTDLLHNWTAELSSSDPIPSHASLTVKMAVHHVGRLCSTLLQVAPSASVESAILSFYEQTTFLVNHERLKFYIRIELPPSTIIYSLLFSSSLATVSRLCHILSSYKKSFEAAMAAKSRQKGSPGMGSLPYDKAYVNKFNGYLMDICNCFWRARAFSDTDTNAHGCMIARRTVSRLTSYVVSVDKSFTLSTMFSLSHSPVLCLQSIQRVRELEDEAAAVDRSIRTRHAGPVTQTSLSKLGDSGGITLSWQEYRVDVLKTLDAKGLGGIGELLKNTMTVLKHSMDAKTGAGATQ
ncbi:Inner centromere protein mis6 [Escovopsis weberi]|uniref:Inner centromere protein mis6 n=1 Tax=Escovopsis weberi TaxID=150374 RepID=A0A0M8N191_ESCWE|nr:Inner centromere protein mis6 [Escovopsis weberi]